MPWAPDTLLCPETQYGVSGTPSETGYFSQCQAGEKGEWQEGSQSTVAL